MTQPWTALQLPEVKRRSTPRGAVIVEHRHALLDRHGIRHRPLDKIDERPSRSAVIPTCQHPGRAEELRVDRACAWPTLTPKSSESSQAWHPSTSRRSEATTARFG